MRGQYIPDLTERFPEGFVGVDLTDRYFPCERGKDIYADWDALDRWEREYEKREREVDE